MESCNNRDCEVTYLGNVGAIAINQSKLIVALMLASSLSHLPLKGHGCFLVIQDYISVLFLTGPVLWSVCINLADLFHIAISRWYIFFAHTCKLTAKPWSFCIFRVEIAFLALIAFTAFSNMFKYAAKILHSALFHRLPPFLLFYLFACKYLVKNS